MHTTYVCCTHTETHIQSTHTLFLGLYYCICAIYIHKNQIIWGDTLVGCVWYRYEFLVVIVVVVVAI